MKRFISLLIPLILISLLFGSCKSTERRARLQSKGVTLAEDPYIGAWDFVVQNTPSGDAEGVINIERTGQEYRAYMHSELGDLSLDHMSIVDERLKGYFRYKGFRVNVKGVFADNTLAGKLAVTLASFPLQATKREP